MPRLFTYTIPIDDGAAPNPSHGLCTLAICKPVIRRVAKSGDWIAGLGSKSAPGGDLSGHLVYAMRVEEVVTLEDYDLLARTRWPHRIPDFDSHLLEDRLGDCIYDFSKGMPVQRPGVHHDRDIETDLGGRNVLISRDFYYFGDHARPLPDYLLPICHQAQGHRSNANKPYFERFVQWIRSIPPAPGQLYGKPDFIINWGTAASCRGCVTSSIQGRQVSVC
jgi:hypothetical protein